MNKIELIGRILFFGFLFFGEIARAIGMHIIAKIAAIIKSPSWGISFSDPFLEQERLITEPQNRQHIL